MINMRIYNNDNTDYCDYEWETIEEIKDQCSERIKCTGWDKGRSERI